VNETVTLAEQQAVALLEVLERPSVATGAAA